MGNEDHRPGSRDADSGKTHDDLESIIGQECVEQYPQQPQRGGNDNSAVGDVVLIKSRGEAGGFA